MKPATARVLRLLHARGAEGVTGMDALREAHVYRLSGRIHELRNDEDHPVEIDTEWRTVDGVRFAVYRLHRLEPVLPPPDRGTQVGAGL